MFDFGSDTDFLQNVIWLNPYVTQALNLPLILLTVTTILRLTVSDVDVGIQAPDSGS